MREIVIHTILISLVLIPSFMKGDEEEELGVYCSSMEIYASGSSPDKRTPLEILVKNSDGKVVGFYGIDGYIDSPATWDDPVPGPILVPEINYFSLSRPPSGTYFLHVKGKEESWFNFEVRSHSFGFRESSVYCPPKPIVGFYGHIKKGEEKVFKMVFDKRVDVPLEVIFDVKIDIKPGSYPNVINLKSKGVIPVAILNEGDFEMDRIIPESVVFGPNKAREAHGKVHFEDIDSDGDLDAVSHFKVQETGIREGDTEAYLYANLIYRTDPAIKNVRGITIEGKDSIVVINE